MRNLLCSCLALVACGPPRQPAIEPAPAEAAPASDPRAIPRWVVSQLIAAGYRCNEDTPTQCMTDADAWQVTVTTRVEPAQAIVMFDSFATRVADQPCHQFKPQIDSLASRETLFGVACNDSSARFRMTTALVYGPALDVPAWMEQHRRSRFAAWTQLENAHAVQR
jgi:hypothetical protein